ncbi:MAG: ABC transporter ATP-binding protein [Chloroflexi bacterium]|nr:ABC transporter ATP-binding protein [Chloroflexota bacterium]
MNRELMVLFGHSGSGKSLTLRAIAGLLRPDSGRIALDGSPLFDTAARVDVPPQRRSVGMVVQSYALFPHLTVRQNVAFGLHGLDGDERCARTDELLSKLQISDLAGRRPDRISGGQAQRVALARALATRPRLLLLDEPFSALDSAIRVGLRREITRLKRDLGLTIVFVTHDIREAYNLADKVAVFDSGVILQTGTRDEVFDRPHSARVAELTEVRNIWRGGRVAAMGPMGVTVEVGPLILRALPGDFKQGDEVDVCIRPERVLLLRSDRLSDDSVRDSIVMAAIIDEVAHGASHTLILRPAGARDGAYDIEVDLASHPYQVMGVCGRRDWALAFPREAVHVMRPG